MHRAGDRLFSSHLESSIEAVQQDLSSDLFLYAEMNEAATAADAYACS
jgi:hypothetical protein